MNSNINDLYLKYRSRIQRSLESDSYYQYLFDLISDSENVITQNNRILHKTVDERWLKAIEDSFEAIDAIIGKPRKFLKTVENLVPLDLAKKISSQSVRHLSQNTQFIAGIQDNMIIPDKILNVENEDSYDLYENRFLATLIKKLVIFIDKRTDIIFWSTGDEQSSTLKLNSVIEDDYEQIDYKLELNIHNKQSYLDNDSRQIETFKRIDRVRRIVMEFNRSKFMALMSGLPQVRSPIQKTNLLIKDRNYRKCYDLWKFLESYEDVGYSVDIKETALDFDEEYLFQLYSNIALNYTVFKSILTFDPRRITDAPAKRRKTVKPKFIKQIVEEFVDDYNIPDVEIRKVIIEEITKAQAEIEKKRLQKEKEAAIREKEKERLRKIKEAQKAKLAAIKARETEKAKLEAQREKDRLRKIEQAEKAKLAAQKAKEVEKAKLAASKARETEKAKLEAQREKDRLRKIEQAEKAKLAAQKAKEVEKAKLAAEKARETQKAKLEAQREKERQQKAKEVEKAKLAAHKAKEAERAKLAAQKAREAEKAKLAAQRERERNQKAKEVEKAKLAAHKAKEAERAKLAAQKAREAEKAKLAAIKKTGTKAQKSASEINNADEK